MMYLDLDELPRALSGSRLWAVERAAPASFRRKDYLGDPSQPLGDAVRTLVEQRIGVRPGGPIRMLTHVRYLGYVFNPVTFYYCLDRSGSCTEAIIAEITNTPWGEVHCYVLDAREPGQAGATRLFELRKEFHISPFMGMELNYRWRFTDPGLRLHVHMENADADGRLFDASLSMARREITPASLRSVLLRYPFMTARVIGGIYWQALRLWWKRAPFHPHPDGIRPSRSDDGRPFEMTESRVA
jgi:DUF1365 family protein